MRRIETAFARAKDEKRAAFVAYVCAGDPDKSTSIRLCRELLDAGVDILELGVPFSDPLADGPTNQRAAERALASGVTQSDVLEIVAAARGYGPRVPIVLYTYYNLVFSNGLEIYVQRAKEAGVDGLLVLDLPPEEGAEYLEICRAAELDTVFLVAPTTPNDRVRYIAGYATGFVYYVSRTGVTGVRDDLAEDMKQQVDGIRSVTDKPLAVGFGIQNAEQVNAVARLADGVVVGSAIVNTISEHLSDPDAMVSKVGSLVRNLVSGTELSETPSE